MKEKGITLIGMPTSGKSTIGAKLAERLDWEMLDVDRWMERQRHMPLADIILEMGVNDTLALETDCIANTDLREKIISTPGSVIYNDVYEPLADQTHIVWLDVPLDEIARRLSVDPNPHRADQIIGIREKGLEGLYRERVPKYRKWAQFVIACAGKSIDTISDEIIRTVR